MEKRPSPLFGQESPTNFLVMNDKGEKVPPEEAICPVVAQGPDDSLRVIGTGFFFSAVGIFATAAHVIADALDANGEPTGAVGVIQFAYGNRFYLRRIVTATRHKVADVAVGRLEPLYNEAGEMLHNKMLKLSTEPPIPGTPIHSYAYPLCNFQREGKRQEVEFRGRYFGGRVIRYFSRGRDRVMMPGPCFETSMAIHPGASGGPVCKPNGRVFGINSSSFADDPVSFVACIDSILDLGIDGIRLEGEDQHRMVTVRELRARNLLA